MTPEKIQALVSELIDNYTDAAEAQDGGRTLVKLPAVQLPPGCQPSSTDVIVVFTPGASKPDLVVRTAPRLPNGALPNTSSMMVAGENWVTYSFNLEWDADRHSAVQFVEGKLRRFALNA